MNKIKRLETQLSEAVRILHEASIIADDLSRRLEQERSEQQAQNLLRTEARPQGKAKS